MGESWPRATSSGITDHERDQRLEMARIALERDDAPIVYYAANALGECDFPTLFHSHAERVVRLIENPPKLRREGFSIWAANHSEIVGGKLRRTMIEGVRLMGCSKSGLSVLWHLETKASSLGCKLRVLTSPFESTILFWQNLSCSLLVDETYLRRIQPESCRA